MDKQRKTPNSVKEKEEYYAKKVKELKAQKDQIEKNLQNKLEEKA